MIVRPSLPRTLAVASRARTPIAFALAAALFAGGSASVAPVLAQEAPQTLAAPGNMPAIDETAPARVGRLSDLTGEIDLAPAGDNPQWSPIDLNYPVATGDNLWAAPGSRAEADFGATQLRLGASTNVNVAVLDDRTLELFVAQGAVVLRVSVLEPGDNVIVDTPTTQVVLRRAGLYRVDVSPDQQHTTVSVREGEATAQVAAGLQQVLPNLAATIDDAQATTARFAPPPQLDALDAWSATRDRVFQSATLATTNYVSPQMVGASDLAQYGTWQPSPEYGNVWFPTAVAPGWAPYSDGYWTTVGGFGLTWVDRAPWGYAPFHYGRWAFMGGRWGWIPGTWVARPVWAPAFVAWTGGGISIAVGSAPVWGWVPLGWREPYRPWWGGCGNGCWNRYNQPYRVDPQWRDHAPPPDHYANWRVPNAVTAVHGDRLVQRKPYAPADRFALSAIQLTGTHPVATVPPMQLQKPAPGAVPVLRSGDRGTPKPAAAYYASSKPAELGVAHRGVTRVDAKGDRVLPRVNASAPHAGGNGNAATATSAGTPGNGAANTARGEAPRRGGNATPAQTQTSAPGSAPMRMPAQPPTQVEAQKGGPRGPIAPAPGGTRTTPATGATATENAAAAHGTPDSAAKGNDARRERTTGRDGAGSPPAGSRSTAVEANTQAPQAVQRTPRVESPSMTQAPKDAPRGSRERAVEAPTQQPLRVQQPMTRVEPPRAPVQPPAQPVHVQPQPQPQQPPQPATRGGNNDDHGKGPDRADRNDRDPNKRGN